MSIALVVIFATTEDNNLLSSSSSASADLSSLPETVSSTDEVVLPLIEMDSKKLDSLKITGKSNIDIYRKDGFLMATGNEDYLRDYLAYDTIAYNFSVFNATKIIENNVSDLKKYGLDKPLYTAYLKFITDSETREITIKFGNSLQDGSTYIISDIENTVFLIKQNFLIDYPNNLSFISKELIPAPTISTEEDNSGEVLYDTITIGNKNFSSPVIISKNHLDDVTHPFNTANYLVYYKDSSEDILGSASHEFLNSNLNIAKAITGTSVVSANPTPAQLTEWGLDDENAAEIIFNLAGNTTHTIKLGKNIDTQHCYAVSSFNNSYKTVVSIDIASAPYKNWTLQNILSSVIFSYNLKDVVDITFDQNNKKDVYYAELDDLGDISKAYKNGSSIEIPSFSNLYRVLINLEQTEKPESVLNFTDQLKIIFNIKKGASTIPVTVLISYGDDRIAALDINNQEYYIKKEQLDILLDLI